MKMIYIGVALMAIAMGITMFDKYTTPFVLIEKDISKNAKNINLISKKVIGIAEFTDGTFDLVELKIEFDLNSKHCLAKIELADSLLKYYRLNSSGSAKIVYCR